jgi:putative DNA methylase
MVRTEARHFVSRSLAIRVFGQAAKRGVLQVAQISKPLLADPFMGGGTPDLSRRTVFGCDVIGFDINPMSYWIVKQEIEHLDLDEYAEAAESLRSENSKTEIGRLVLNKDANCGSAEAHAKYFLWVKKRICHICGKDMTFFPDICSHPDSRHPKNVIVCGKCGELSESGDRKNPGLLPELFLSLAIEGPAKRSLCKCPECGDQSLSRARFRPPGHRLFAIEYHCPNCKPTHSGRFFKKPDEHDLGKLAEVSSIWAETLPKHVPDDEIPSGDETNRLLRWGYKRYREMFNERQLLALELSAEIVSRTPNQRVRNALATNLSDLLRYQNMLCRYDKRL